MKNYFCFLLCIILSFNVFGINVTAGVRVVGNGGGLAELETYYIFANLSHFYSYCLMPASPCLLAPTQVEQLKEFDQNRKTFIENGISFFNHTNDNNDTNGTNDKSICRFDEKQKLLLNSLVIYDQDQRPKTSGEIASLIIACGLNKKYFVEPDYLNLTLKWLNSTIGQTSDFFNTSLITVNGLKTKLHNIELKNNSQHFITQLVVLESRDNSYDLTPMLSMALECNQQCLWQLERLQIYKVTQIDLKGVQIDLQSPIQWQNKGIHFVATLLVHLRYNQNQDLQMEISNIEIVSKIQD